jgi:hypothetical protein
LGAACVLIQEAAFGDLQFKEAGLEILGVYHPFWLRIGLEVVTGHAVPKTNEKSRSEDGDRVARQHLQVWAFVG